MFCLLFEISFNDNIYDDILTIIDMAKMERLLEPTEYTICTIQGVLENLTEIDGFIEQYSSGWKVSRFARVTLAILRLAIYEAEYAQDVPENVAINEAIELAKEYDSEDAPAFINGILGSISRRAK